LKEQAACFTTKAWCQNETDFEVNTTKSHCYSPLKASCPWIW